MKTPVVFSALGLVALALLTGCGDDNVPDTGTTGTSTAVWCQIHSAICLDPDEASDTCNEQWIENNTPLFSWFYRFSQASPANNIGGPQTPYAYLDDVSYRPAAGAVTNEHLFEAAPGEPACAAPGDDPNVVCAALCGTNRQATTVADGRASLAAHPPSTVGGTEPYCVGFPVTGDLGNVADPGSCHLSKSTQALTQMSGNPSSPDLYVRVAGAAAGSNTVSIGGATGDIPITDGYITLKLTDPYCRNGTPCRARINKMELRYAGIVYTVDDRAFNITDLTLNLADPLDVDVQPIAGTGDFRIDLAVGTKLYVTGKRDGTPQSLAATLPPVFPFVPGVPAGTIIFNPTTGATSADVSWSASIDGNTIGGTTFVSQYLVFNRPPDINGGADQTAFATDASCSASVDVTGTAADPDGSFLRTRWRTGGTTISQSNTASATLGIGDHVLTFSGLDGSASQADDDVIAHIIDATLPEFVDPDETVTLRSCSPAQTSFHLPVPPARNLCSPDAPTVTGTVIVINGSPVSIPITDGTAALPAGVHTVRWTATNQNGSVEFDQEIRVISEPTLHALKSLVVGKEANITAGPVLFGTVMNTGPSRRRHHSRNSIGNAFTRIEFGADVGDVLSGPFLELLPRVHVHGFAVHSDGVRRGPNVTIDGGLIDLDDFPGPTVPWNPPAFAGGGFVFVGNGETETLAPGSYHALDVRPGGTVILGNGVYIFKKLDAARGATVVVPDQAAGVSLYVLHELDFRGDVELAGGTPAPLFLGYAGDDTITLDTTFWGIVVVHRSRLELTDGLRGFGHHRHFGRHGHHGHRDRDPASYRGRFYAKELEVEDKVNVDHDTLLCTPDP